MTVLLVWEEVPESTKFYRLEGEVADAAIRAHGCFVNVVDGDPDGAADRTGKAVMETFPRKVANAVNTDKYHVDNPGDAAAVPCPKCGGHSYSYGMPLSGQHIPPFGELSFPERERRQCKQCKFSWKNGWRDPYPDVIAVSPP